MVFSAPIFVFCFLPVALALHACLPRGVRNLALTLASLFFYAWGEGAYVALMLASIGVNYGFGRWLDGSAAGTSRRLIVASAVGVNLLALGWFKYANFVADNLGLQLAPVHLPIGISFFTFQALSYVVDVYRGEVRAQRNPIDLAAYVSLFPQLIAGPIVRYADVAAALAQRRVELPLFASGVRRFIVGLAKKLLLANGVGLVADRIFETPALLLTSAPAWLGVLCYTFQIYFDFSGYSDMAIGLGRMFGFSFLENFDHPYAASSVRDFWRRWHISLSTWFRDYLYIPLGGARGSAARTYANLVIVFLLCGLWHGASWTFVAWGAFHGAFLVLERVGFGSLIERLPRVVRHLYTCLIVMLGWVLFRADSMGHAVAMLGAMFGLGASDPALVPLALHLDAKLAVTLAVCCVAALPTWQVLWRRVVARGWAATPAVAVIDVVLHASLLLACVMALLASTYNPFIYFRF